MSFEPPRSDFPILAREVNGKPLAYLDSAASAQKPKAVLDAMTEFATTEFANVHRGVHTLAAAATQRYEAARARVARFINAKHSDEIIFTRSGTEALNLVSYSFLSPRISAGDEIVLTRMEHHSNIVPWHFMRERKRAVLKWVDVRDDGTISPPAIQTLLTPKTKLLAVTHMSNVLGTINPLKEIISIAHAKGVPVVVDGCQGVVHDTVDVQELDADFYAFTGHKLYGPTGIGVLYGKRAHLKSMRPFNGGGEMIQEVSRDRVTYAEPPARFEAGTPPIIEAIGLAAAIDYLAGFNRAAVREYECAVYTYAREAVRQFNWLRVIGEAPNKGAILSFETQGMHAHDVATILDHEGVAVRAGHHCAQPLMERFDVTSTTRASFALYSTREDVDRLIAGLAKARKILAE